MSKLTPMMRQYKEIKANYKECILFFRLGDFYEMFFDDAIIASEILGIALTGKSCGLEERAPMCGIPFHSSKMYIQKLIKSGKKVAICEQVEDPKTAKGIVKREVIQIFTPGTIIDEDVLDNSSNNYILSIYQKENNNLEACYIDVSTGEKNNTSINKSELYQLLLKVNPKELVINQTFSETLENNQLEKTDIITDYLTSNSVIINLLDEESINQFIENKKIQEKSKAAQALYCYINNTQNSFNPEFFHEKNRKQLMNLDYYTLKNLEIITNIKEGNKYSLFWVLDKNKTSMGSRRLKQMLISPLQDKESIDNRLDIIEAFYNNYILVEDLNIYLKEIYDFERITNKLAYNTVTQRDLINLKKSISVLPKIKSLLMDNSDEKLNFLANQIDTLEDLYNFMDTCLEDPDEQENTSHIIKTGYNEELDKYRSLRENTSNILLDMEKQQQEETGVKSLKIGYNKVTGYYIEITKTALKNIQIPKDYIRKQTLSASERFINTKLKDLEEEILYAKDREEEIESTIYLQIKNQLKTYIPKILKQCDLISDIDVFSTIAQVSFENNYVRPTIQKDANLKIISGRHPVIEKIMSSENFVPNDTIMNKEEIHLITGPNMAGKSTYMRQVAIIVLMSHCGFFVPASEATIPEIDCIYTRIGANDDLTMGKSTFMVEMTEVASILNSASKNSLIIMDEIGRGTSTFDGMSLAFAIIIYILKKIKANTLISTHYHELTVLEERYDKIKNYTMKIDEGKELNFLRKVVKGKSNKSYGIHVAKLASLPKDVIKEASDFLKILENNEIQVFESQIDINQYLKQLTNKQENIASEEKEELEELEEKTNLYEPIIDKIKDLDINDLSPKQAWIILEQLNKSVKEI